MAPALWQLDELPFLLGDWAPDDAGCAAVTGFSIDTRTISPGDLFVALKDQRDGHDFVRQAFANGAVAALVERGYTAGPHDGFLLRVADPLRGLEAIARAARARLSASARVIAVTGSVGKTGTKDMLRAVLAAAGPTHGAEKSYNNHWGVPLTLARMPGDTHFGVFEIGMNHAGEITPLTACVRPHIAIVTTVGPVHLEFFDSVAGIARAKAEIFSGLEPGGTAIINRDNEHYHLLRDAAVGFGARIISFGMSSAGNAGTDADVFATDVELTAAGSTFVAHVEGAAHNITLRQPGAHVVSNTLSVLAAVAAAGVDSAVAIPVLANLTATAGRGARDVVRVPGGSVLLIDESYNANPTSMRAALAALATVDRASHPRRVVALGDMLELGPHSGALHQELAAAVEAAGVDLVFASGPNMRLMFDALPTALQGAWGPASEGISGHLVDALSPGDAIMIKGSLGSKMATCVAAVRDRRT